MCNTIAKIQASSKFDICVSRKFKLLFMEDPWKKLDGAAHSESSQEDIKSPQSFDDNFQVPIKSTDSIKVSPPLFEPLEDSQSYLANLGR